MILSVSGTELTDFPSWGLSWKEGSTYHCMKLGFMGCQGELHSFPESGGKLFTQPQFILWNINPVVFVCQESCSLAHNTGTLPSFTPVACWLQLFVKFLNCPKGEEPGKFSWKDLVQLFTILTACELKNLWRCMGNTETFSQIHAP